MNRFELGARLIWEGLKTLVGGGHVEVEEYTDEEAEDEEFTFYWMKEDGDCQPICIYNIPDDSDDWFRMSSAVTLCEQLREEQEH